MNIRVYYEDTDSGGVVYYANYLKFCERARSELFFKEGLSPHSANSFFVVKELKAKYLSSARLGDLLHCSIEVLELKKVSLTLRQHISKDGQILFSMDVTLAYLHDGKLAKIPSNFLSLFISSQGER